MEPPDVDFKCEDPLRNLFFFDLHGINFCVSQYMLDKFQSSKVFLQDDIYYKFHPVHFQPQYALHTLFYFLRDNLTHIDQTQSLTTVQGRMEFPVVELFKKTPHNSTLSYNNQGVDHTLYFDKDEPYVPDASFSVDVHVLQVVLTTAFREIHSIGVPGAMVSRPQDSLEIEQGWSFDEKLLYHGDG